MRVQCQRPAQTSPQPFSCPAPSQVKCPLQNTHLACQPACSLCSVTLVTDLGDGPLGDVGEEALRRRRGAWKRLQQGNARIDP
jgi:hypothetical protein